MNSKDVFEVAVTFADLDFVVLLFTGFQKAQTDLTD